MDMSWLIHTVIMLIMIGMCAGLLYWLVQKAPFIPEPFKAVILWVILAVCVIFLIVKVLLPLAGGNTSPVLRR